MHEVKPGQKYRRAGDWRSAESGGIVEVEAVQSNDRLDYVSLVGGPRAEPTNYFFPSQDAFLASGYLIGYVLVEEPEEEVVQEDKVNHPSHYTSDPSGVECIQITRHRNFNVGNAIKYLWRAGLKEDASLDNLEKEIQDLEKAAFYIQDEIKRKRGE